MFLFWYKKNFKCMQNCFILLISHELCEEPSSSPEVRFTKSHEAVLHHLLLWGGSAAYYSEPCSPGKCWTHASSGWSPLTGREDTSLLQAPCAPKPHSLLLGSAGERHTAQLHSHVSLLQRYILKRMSPRLSLSTPGHLLPLFLVPHFKRQQSEILKTKLF